MTSTRPVVDRQALSQFMNRAMMSLDPKSVPKELASHQDVDWFLEMLGSDGYSPDEAMMLHTWVYERSHPEAAAPKAAPTPAPAPAATQPMPAVRRDPDAFETATEQRPGRHAAREAPRAPASAAPAAGRHARTAPAPTPAATEGHTAPLPKVERPAVKPSGRFMFELPGGVSVYMPNDYDPSRLQSRQAPSSQDYIWTDDPSENARRRRLNGGAWL